MPYLSQLSSFTYINNHLDESEDKQELKTEDNNIYVNNSQMRCPLNSTNGLKHRITSTLTMA
jgi:hypothetical protein